MDTKDIELKVKFKIEDNYVDFRIYPLNINYSYESRDFVIFVELYGDMNKVGYAILYGKSSYADDIYATYDATQWKLAKKDYLEIISENMD